MNGLQGLGHTGIHSELASTPSKGLRGTFLDSQEPPEEPASILGLAPACNKPSATLNPNT